MSCWKSGPILGAVIGIALAITAPAQAVAPEVKDEGKFFSPEAVKKANKVIREIARRYGQDLFIDTVPSVPGDQAEKVKTMAPAERKKFFRNWATDRAQAAVVDGIYILVCKEPGHAEIVYTNLRVSSVFPREATAKLDELLLKQFHDKHYDEGLLQAVEFVRDRWAAPAK